MKIFTNIGQEKKRNVNYEGRDLIIHLYSSHQIGEFE